MLLIDVVLGILIGFIFGVVGLLVTWRYVKRQGLIYACLTTVAIKVILSLVVIIYSSAFSNSIKGHLSEVVLVCILSVLI